MRKNLFSGVYEHRPAQLQTSLQKLARALEFGKEQKQVLYYLIKIRNEIL